MTADFQASSSSQGNAFEQAVATLLKINGWQVEPKRLKIHDSEVDIVATDLLGVTWWIECKGSWQSKSGQNGAKRNDTVKKAIGVAWHLSLFEDRPPYMLITSHLPPANTSTGRMLAAALDHGLFTAVHDLDGLLQFVARHR